MCCCAAGIEETWQIQQQQIVAAVEQGAARKAFDLQLPQLGPYSIAYTRSGRHMVLGGARGHLAVMEWQRSHLTCEVQVGAGTAGWGLGRNLSTQPVMTPHGPWRIRTG